MLGLPGRAISQQTEGQDPWVLDPPGNSPLSYPSLGTLSKATSKVWQDRFCSGGREPRLTQLGLSQETRVGHPPPGCLAPCLLLIPGSKTDVLPSYWEATHERQGREEAQAGRKG